MINTRHSAAETDASSLDFIMAVIQAIDPEPFEVEKWERMLAQYRAMGPRYIATLNATDRIFGELCRLQTELEGILNAS